MLSHPKGSCLLFFYVLCFIHVAIPAATGTRAGDPAITATFCLYLAILTACSSPSEMSLDAKSLARRAESAAVFPMAA